MTAATTTRGRAAAEDELLTLAQAVDFLDISKSTMYRLIDQGKIKCSKVGRQWRFRREDLDAYLEPGRAVAWAPADELEVEVRFFEQQLNKLGLTIPDEQLGGEEKDPGERNMTKLALEILWLAFYSRASDVHIQPMRRGDTSEVSIRYRIDGVLHEIRGLPMSLHESLVLWFKVAMGADVGERRVPQDGRLVVQTPKKPVDVRVTTLPTVLGEALTTRLLDMSPVLLGPDDIGMANDSLALLRKWTRRPVGLVIFTGPSGSGKTTVMYGCLNEIVQPEKKVVTIEDPVEIIIPGATQMHVNPKTGATFERCIRAAFRSDPDIVMVGEIRNAEIAHMCCQLVLTGHLALTTLHTTTAVEALERLRDIGLPPFLITSSVTGIMSQRLIRVLCPKCKAPAKIPAAVLKQVWETAEAGGHPIPEGTTFLGPVGCQDCKQTGYTGRTGVYELLEMSEDLKEAFVEDASLADVTTVAVREGMRTMFIDGVQKAAAGQTSLEEVMRVCPT